MNSNMAKIKVWDPLVRIGHWLLVLGFITAYLTGDDGETIHLWAGYTISIILLIRILWGFIGSKHARFKDFLYHPKAIWQYLINLIRRKPQHYLGHNPAGGAMVVALLLSLSMTAYSGMAILAIEENAGPLASIYAKTDTQHHGFVQSAYASGMANGDSAKHHLEEIWEERHEFFVNLTLLLVLLHISGVIASSIIDKEKLVKAMITGEKEVEGAD